MRWLTLFNRLGRQPLKNTQHDNIYALIENPKTRIRERVYLRLSFDTRGKPYLVPDEKAQELYEREMDEKFPHRKETAR